MMDDLTAPDRIRPVRLLATLAMTVGIVTMLIGRCDAAYTGLIVIPTADIAEYGEYEIEPEIERPFTAGAAEEAVLGTEIGLTPRMEAGLDYGLGGEADTLLLDAKYVLIRGAGHTPVVAAGAYNIGGGPATALYVVTTTDLGAFRGHLGLLHSGDEDAWFAGADKRLSRRWLLEADYTSGEERVSSIGADYLVTENFIIEAGLAFSSEADEGTILSVDFEFAGSFLGHEAEPPYPQD